MLTGSVLLFVHAPDVNSAMSMFLESRLEHQERAAIRQYGAHPFGFRGTHPELGAFWQRPVFSGPLPFKPTFLAFAGLCLLAAFLARSRTMAQLAALTAGLTAAAQLSKMHACGSYVVWFYPFLIIGLCGPQHVPASRSYARRVEL